MADWLRSLVSKDLPLTAVASNAEGTLDSLMWGSYPASIRYIGGSIQVPDRVWYNARESTRGLPPPVKWESGQRSWSNGVLLWKIVFL
jgi:hypothetical protein